MADEYFYGKHAVPPAVEQGDIVKSEFGSLHENQTLNTGVITREKNLSTDAYPYLTPREMRVKWGDSVRLIAGDHASDTVTGLGDVREDNISHYSQPLGMFGFRDCLFIISAVDGVGGYSYDIVGDPAKTTEESFPYASGIKIRYKQGFHGLLRPNVMEFTRADNAFDHEAVSSHFVVGGFHGWNDENAEEYGILIRIYRNLRCGYTGYTGFDIGHIVDERNAGLVTGSDSLEFTRFKDKTHSSTYTYEVFCGNGQSNPPTGIISARSAAVKPLRYYSCTHLGRIFVAGIKYVAASNYNEDGFSFDTSTTYSAYNAWETILSARENAGDVTGICSYGGHVVVFRKNYMHEIHNTKNPFRVVDIGAVGCVDYRSIAEVDGVLFFAAEDGIYTYTGTTLPKLISEPLRIKKWDKAVAGGHDHKYYLYGEGYPAYDTSSAANAAPSLQGEGEGDEPEKVLYVFDMETGTWCEEDAPEEGIISFAKTDFGFFCMTGGGEIYRIDTDSYDGQDWFFETDIYTEAHLNNKRVRKVDLYGDFAEDTAIRVYLLRHDEVFDAEESRLVYEKTFNSAKRASIRIPIRNSGGEGYKLRIEGIGYAKIYHMETVLQKDRSGFRTT